MLLPLEPGRAWDAEDVLRSLGAVLDTIRARSVLIRQSDAGLVLRARVTNTLQDRLEDRWSDIERHMTPADIARYQAEALARRGSGHVAGPHERSLRMIGRHIDSHRLDAVTLIEDRSEGSWLMWHGADPDDGPRLAVLDGDALLFEDARVAAQRRARERRAPDGGTPKRPSVAEGPLLAREDPTRTVPDRPPTRPLARVRQGIRIDQPHP